MQLFIHYYALKLSNPSLEFEMNEKVDLEQQTNTTGELEGQDKKEQKPVTKYAWETDEL